ncbi:MAG: bis(5'-nucleosyl)-tetraphosphatase, partial [Minisyncoccales bacterium]
YLLLHYPGTSHRAKKDYWDFPKGHLEKGEKLEETAKREIEEETGLKDIKFIEGFKETIKYFFKWEGKNVLKFVTFFLVKTKTKNVQVSTEHLGYAWLHFEEAMEKLTFKNAKEILKKANEFLKKIY